MRPGKILVIGCGAVGQAVLQNLSAVTGVAPSKITVVDFQDRRNEIGIAMARGTKFKRIHVTPENYIEVLTKFLAPGDLCISLAWNVDTMDVLRWCQANNVRYVNTAVEIWDHWMNYRTPDPDIDSLAAFYSRLQKDIDKFPADGPTAILDHGANPGLITSIARRAVLDMASHEWVTTGRKDIQERLGISGGDIAMLAGRLGIHTVHVSEHDTQFEMGQPSPYEFVNTWSVEGFLEEGTAWSEIAWGTWPQLEAGEDAVDYGNGLSVRFPFSGIDFKAHYGSWVPSGNFNGFIIRHAEVFGIANMLTSKTLGTRPTVMFVYRPCSAAMKSIEHFQNNENRPLPRTRTLRSEIIAGSDELGVLLIGKNRAWWTGSVLDIDTARRLMPGQNATTVQVAAGLLAAVEWVVTRPNRGVLLPEQVDHDFILKAAKPFLGNFISGPSDFR